MGRIVELPNSRMCMGYLATPESGTGPGVVVIQEWWGLVDHIKDVAERFGDEGFVALAPDLYRGKATTEPDEAGKLLMQMEMDQAAQDMSAAVEYLLACPEVEPKKVGTVGFCAGGGLALMLAATEPLGAAVPFYPAFAHGEPDYSGIRGAVQFHVAEHDEWTTPQKVEKIVDQLQGMGKSAEMHVYPGTGHAFFNDTRSEVFAPDAARQAWNRTLAFLRRNLA